MSICFVLTSFTLNRVLELEHVAHRKTFGKRKSQLSPFLSNSLLEQASDKDLNLAITFSNKDSGTNTFNEQMPWILWD